MMMSRSHGKRERERDRISELPEPLIQHIFSFLPIKSVVSTSVLSTKWRYYWKSTPSIDLREWRSPDTSIGIYQEEVNRFMGFVDRLLSNRQDVHSPSIQKFGLYFDTYFDISRVKGWISTVLRHKVEELALMDRKHIVFPPCLFTCESLTVLEIYIRSLELPESVNFPKLKILRLNVSLFDDIDEQMIQKLLSSSPILEELSLDVRICKIPYLSICGPNLKRLFINGPLCWDFNIHINAPNLQSFRYSRVLANDFVLHNFSTLVAAEVVLTNPVPIDSRGSGELGGLARKLFGSLSYVKHLTISDYSLKLLSYENHFQTSLPSFYYLTHLEVTSASLYFGYSCRDEGKLPCWIVGILLDFLHISPNLKSLVFAEGFPHYESNNNDSWSPDFLPQCLLLHLKSIEFRGFFWNEFEKDLVRFLMKNSKVLERVKITISGRSVLSTSSNYRKKVVNDILLFPVGSGKCSIQIS
ncbi:F-box/FBD/LRR-repeat protein At2g26030-like [Papaver somniferum]|uniref:F-box/FBD/LRR-repeat protein At2g26030-like n=1 Tax=Papaver somniferum TaxID=3469 RepID=UPI000E702DC6|nr:F-box/FBD/LRR-repeat protein At2g26030-like [Papaver somniferum]